MKKINNNDQVAKKGNISIWKIDENMILLRNLKTEGEIDKTTSEDKIQRILNAYKKSEKERSKKENRDPNNFDEVSISSSILEEKNIKIYRKKRYAKGLFSLLQKFINTEEHSEESFLNSNNDLICFIYGEKNIFAITSGTGHHVISLFSDSAFPFFVAKKIFSGEFSKAEARKITGSVYSEVDHFRGNGYSFSRREGFGKVWRNLTGKIKTEVIKGMPTLHDFLDPKKPGNAEIKSSIIIKKSITFEQLVRLINELEGLPKLTKEEIRKFAFLDTLKEIKSEEQQNLLKEGLLEELFNIIQKEKFEEAEKFDFCHPKEILSFFSGEKFAIQSAQENVVSESDPPKASDVLRVIKEKTLVDLDTISTFTLTFEQLSFSFQVNEEDKSPISADILKYFHGEILHNKKTYFLVDGKWYETSETFLENLKDDFLEIMFDDKIFQEDVIPFIEWEKTKNKKGNLTYLEGDYNLKQGDKDDFYYGDKIFAKVDRGEIELFDLLYVDKEKNIVYVIQVKNKFDGAMRDACSQIRMASEIIETDIGNNMTILKDYYQSWKNSSINSLSEESFLELFDKDKFRRKYVLACSDKNFTREKFEKNKLFSHIAKFETLELEKYFRGEKIDFLIQNIHKK